MRHGTFRIAATAVFLLASCGGGGTNGQPDVAGADVSLFDVQQDPGNLDDATADRGPNADPGMTDEAGVDPGGTDVVAVDLPEDVVPDAPECASDEACEGRVTGLGICRVPRCEGGLCVAGTAAEGASCQDGSACTDGDTCAGGACVAGPARNCDDGSLCTLDLCDPATGCGHPFLEGPCDDGSKCTLEDACVAGACVGTTASCDDGNPCTQDGCDRATGCTHVALDGGACDDGSACATDTACVAGQCKGTALDCDDHESCTVDTCEPATGCRHEPAPTGGCDDGNDCTIDDRCDEGACAGTPRDCDDGLPCTDDSCVTGQGCVHVYGTGACDDLNPCTLADTCAGGTCRGNAMTCDSPPPNECDGDRMISRAAVGVCAAGTCEYATQIVDCPQGCQAGKCLGDPCAGIDCTGSPGACFQAPGTCLDGSCTWAFLDRTACDDANPCTAADACTGGVCAGAPVPCNQPPPDTCADARTLLSHSREGTCAAATGLCAYPTTPLACAGGCVDGICLDTLGLLQADLVPGGRADLSDGANSLPCVLPGWAGTVRIESPNYQVTAGFEP